MNTLQNLHQHCTFCDGKDTPEEVVLEAIKKGFGAIGFSSHCYMPIVTYSMTAESTPEYCKEINRLKEVYKDQIDVFLGLEYDHCCPIDPVGYDYLIGSLHNLYIDGEYRNFDGIPEKHKAMVTDYFGGDGLAFAKEYYRQLAQLPDRAPIDIIGHYDLITRYQDTQPLFDWDDKSYRNAAIECAEALAGRVPLFELNCGAVIRGTRTTPYPQDFITKELKRLGFGVVITTDCHQKHQMDAWMEEGKEFLRSCGYTERHILTKDGFIPVPL